MFQLFARFLIQPLRKGQSVQLSQTLSGKEPYTFLWIREFLSLAALVHRQGTRLPARECRTCSPPCCFRELPPRAQPAPPCPKRLNCCAELQQCARGALFF